MITKESFLAKAKRRYVEVLYDGECYRLQSLTERERAQYELQLQDKKLGRATDASIEKMRRLFVAKTLVDEAGSRLFSDEESEQLGEVDGRIMGLLYERAQRHCGYDSKEIEELAKNSGAAAG
jgi:hypothetical protein